MTDFQSRIGFSPMWKIFSIGVLILILLIPLMMVRSLIDERSIRYDEAVAEISSRWGNEQSFSGPMIVVPYTEVVSRDKNGPVYAYRSAYFLPEDLKIDGALEAEKRKISIYEAVLYSVNLKVQGVFRLPTEASLRAASGGEITKIHWDRAFAVIGISDTRGIKQDLAFEWDGARRSFLPGTNRSQLFATGLHSAIHLDGKGGTAPFKFNLQLLGSRSLSFTPIGKSTNVKLEGGWGDPGFTGALLPEPRTITDNHFTAEWNASYYGRSYGQILIDPEADASGAISASSFGFQLIQTVDHYQKSERAAKYGILFLLLTFTAFFLFEIYTGLRLHPLQYLMVGSAMVVFYLLFVSLSEHVVFVFAYLIAALATTGLISAYAAVILRSRKRAGILAGLLAALYSYLYVVMTSEDSALLLGSIALFGFLSLVMYLTRKIDWYAMGKAAPAGALK